MLGLGQTLKTGHNPSSDITLDPRVTKALTLGLWRWYLTETPATSSDLMDGVEVCKPVSCLAKSYPHESTRLHALCGWKVPIINLPRGCGEIDGGCLSCRGLVVEAQDEWTAVIQEFWKSLYLWVTNSWSGVFYSYYRYVKHVFVKI